MIPGECSFPGCDESAKSVFEPHCSDEHADACLRAFMRMLNGETGDRDEMCREELASIRAAPELSPNEMQERVDELERKLRP